MSESDPPPPADRAEPGGSPFRLLFVCTGNTCRSPLSEAIAARALEARGWHEVRVASAGVSAVPSAKASEGAVQVAARRGLDLGAHGARRVTPELVEEADLILTMSAAHLQGVMVLGGGGRASVITDFAEGRETGLAGGAGEVPDPYGGDVTEYEATYRALEELVERVLDRLAPVVAP